MGRSIIGQGTITAVFLPYPLNPDHPTPSSSLQTQPPLSAPPPISGRQFAPCPELTPLWVGRRETKGAKWMTGD